MHQAYGLPINAMPPIQFLIPPSVLQQSPHQLSFQQQQHQQQQFIYQQHQLAYQQQQYLMQMQQQAQFIHQQQQQQQQQQLNPIQESPSKTIQFLTDEDESTLNQLSNIKVKRIPNQLKNLRHTNGSKATNRLAFAKSKVEDGDQEEFEADRGCEQVNDDQSQSSTYDFAQIHKDPHIKANSIGLLRFYDA
jgi:hypothetical protein